MTRFASALVALLALAVTVAVTSPGTAVAFTGPVLSPAEVVEIDRARDGSRVTVEGEAVGEHLRAIGGGRWVNLLGDETGLGIWVTDEMAEEITYFGDYRHTGDTVRVTGPVNVACEEHGGEFDVHAETFDIVEVGEPREHEIEPFKGVVGAAGIAIALLLWRLYGRRRDRRMV